MRTNTRVTGIVVQDGKILLIHRFRSGEEYWVFPGGGVEEGETLEQALRREMFEETSLELRSARFLCQAEGPPVCVFYVCEMQPGEPQLGGPELEDHSPTNQYFLEWVPLDRITSLHRLFPSPQHDEFVRFLDAKRKDGAS